MPSKHGCFILQDSAVDVFKTIVGRSGLKAIMEYCYLGSTPSILCEFSQRETNGVKEASELSEKLAAQQTCWHRQETSWNWRSLYQEENSASSLKENEPWCWKALGGNWVAKLWRLEGWNLELSRVKHKGCREGWEGGGEKSWECLPGCVPSAGGNPLLVFSEISQELLHASGFILGTVKGLHFALWWWGNEQEWLADSGGSRTSDPLGVLGEVFEPS